jgi:uncharacterized protein (TIGR02996 family)
LTVEAALAAIERGDHAAARDALVVAWRARRAPAIAEAVGVLDVRAPDALSAQLAAIVTPRVTSSFANLKQLAKVDDPRLASWVLAALANPPFCAATAEGFLVYLAKTIERLRDPRLVAELPAIRPILTARLTRKPVYTKVLRVLDAAAAKLRAPKSSPLDERLAAAVAPLRQPAHTIESLLAEVYAHPNDDAPRMVLADVLLERGDPRGEFITLQLARGRDGEPSERERELLKKHGKSWLGPLGTVLSFGKGYSGTKFQRGFVARADFIFKIEKKLALIASDPAWATVETGPLRYILLERAPLHALREVDLDEGALAALFNRTEPLPSVVKLSIDRFTPIQIPLLRRLFPALARLELGVLPDDLAALASLGVRELEIDLYCAQESIGARRREHADFVARVLQMPALFERLAIRPPWYDWHTKPDLVVYARGATGNFAVAA